MPKKIPKHKPETRLRRILVSIEVPRQVDVRQLPGFVRDAVKAEICKHVLPTRCSPYSRDEDLGWGYLDWTTVRAKSVAFKPKRPNHRRSGA